MLKFLGSGGKQEKIFTSIFAAGASSLTAWLHVVSAQHLPLPATGHFPY
jgi:hypothetical protein